MTGVWLAGALALAAALVWWLRRRYDRFHAWAAAHLRAAHPDLTIERQTPGDVTGHLAGVPVRLDLPSLFRRLRGRQDAAALDRLVDEMRAGLPAPEPLPFAYARGAVLPLLKHAAFAAVFRRYPPPLQLVTLPFVEGLVVTYVLWGFQQITYVTAGMLQAWRVTPDDLHHLALANLRRRTEHLLSELGGPQQSYAHLDGFEAARILIPDLITPADVTDPVLAIPDEHVLLIATTQDRAWLARAAAAAHATGRSPLTPAVFRVREASLVPEVVS